MRPASESPLRFPRTRRSAATTAPGFTLAEVLIVIVIVATLAVAAAPLLSSSIEQMQADALAREIATDIRYAQARAVRTGIRHRVSFWIEGQAYAVRYWDDGSWELCQHPVSRKPWRFEIDEHSRYAGLRLKDAQFGEEEYLYWDPNGSPDAGGLVTFTLGRNTRTLHVAPLSGKVTVE
jgi:prepilin-type N-terminal cleavage/methylation domain-containing protein